MEETHKLSYLKIGKKEFHLEVGDQFFTNGHCFTYSPIGRENRMKYHQHSDTYSATTSIEVLKRHKESILEGHFSNLKKRVDDKRLNFITWTVTEVDEVIIEKLDLGELMYLGIGVDSSRVELFNCQKVAILNDSKKQLITNPLQYYSSWNKEEYLNKILSRKSGMSSNRLSIADVHATYIHFQPNMKEEEKSSVIHSWKDRLYQLLHTEQIATLRKALEDLELLRRLELKAFNI